MDLDFEVFGDVQVARTILRPGERADDARPAWRVIIDDLLEIGGEQFRTEGGRAHKWAALAPSTRESKAREGLPPDINVATGETRDAASKWGASGQEIQLHEDFMLFRITTEQAPHLHHGTADMPARKLVDLTERDRQRWVRFLQRFIMTGEAFAL